MFYAVINSGGKQYRVSEGDVIEVDKITARKDEKIKFDQVMLFVSDTDVKVGKPGLKDVEVVAKFLGDIKGDKVRVAKFKAKSKYRRVTGFRSQMSKLQIESIKFQGKSSSAVKVMDDKKEIKPAKEEKTVAVKPKKATVKKAK